MIFFWRKKSLNESGVEKSLRGLNAITPAGYIKKRIKSRLMSAIRDNADCKEYSNVVTQVHELAQDIVASKELRTTMRRRIMNRISLDLGSYSFFDVLWLLHPLPRLASLRREPCGRGVFNRAFTASAMIFVISFVSIFTFQLNTPVSYAKVSVLRNIDGDVYVYRSGMLLPAADGFVLAEGDKIHTGYDSSATVIFMDDTVSRLGFESKLNLSRLFSEEVTGGTEVVLGVAEGRVWSKVSSLISGSFSVATLHTVTKAQRNATFDVNVAVEDKVSISVIENFVDVELSSYSPAVNTTVTEGESLIVQDRRNTIVSLDKKDEWLRMNMSKDEFESKLLAQEDVLNLEEVVGTLPTEKLYGVKTFKENLGIVLSINQREKLATQLAIAEKRLAEAEVLLSKGLSGSAEEVLREYKQIMLDITREYDSLIGIADIEAELSAMILRDKRRYYTTLPGSSLYEVKEVVKEVEFLLANDRIRANQIALHNASDDLYQVFDLLGHGGRTIAEVSISDYPTILQNMFRDLAVYSQSDKDSYIRAAFETALSDLKTINALNNSFGGEEFPVLGVKGRVVKVLDEYFEIFNTDAVYDDLFAEFEILQKNDLSQLVKLSEFVGVSDQNAATVDVALEGGKTGGLGSDSEPRYSE